MKRITSLLCFGFVGTGIGAMVMTVLVLCINGMTQIDTMELLYWLAASFLLGVVTMILYSDKLHFLLLTAIHFVLSFGIVFGAVYSCGYADSVKATLRAMEPEFIIIYAVIFLIVYTVSKLNEYAVNKALHRQK